MGHPNSRAERRHARCRVITRRVHVARNAADGFDPDRDAPRPDRRELPGRSWFWPRNPSRFGKSKVFCTCSWCNGPQGPADRWRWDRALDGDRDVHVHPVRQQGIGRRSERWPYRT
jgi:hypothetical protein